MTKPVHTDPVAQNIRNQQQMDARPPENEHNRTHTCSECSVENKTVTRRELNIADCPRRQAPRDPTKMLCEDCADSLPTIREEAITNAKKRNKANHIDTDVIAVTIFNCGAYEYVETPEQPTTTEEVQVGWDDDDNPIMEEKAVPVPYADSRPQTPIRCMCGSDIDEVVNLDGE